MDIVGDRFRIVRLAAQGGVGSVYRATDELTGRDIAIKLVDGRAARRERLEREARTLEGLTHPSIVRYVAHGAHAEGYYLAMEWLAGENLATRLERGPLSVDDTIALGIRIADGLAAAHATGTIHRDLKPSNIVLAEGRVGAARIVDFGLARHDDYDTLTRPGTPIGTFGYMAPEQARGEPVDARADIYALGATLFECLTQMRADVAARDATVSKDTATQSDAPPSARALRADVPQELDALLKRLMMRDPAARMGDAGSVRDALREIETGERPRVVIADRYEVLGEIGQGGAARVFRARDRETSREVAIKIPRPDGGDRTQRARFLREAKVAMGVESANTVRILDVGSERPSGRGASDDDAPYLVMELLDGRDLAAEIASGPVAIADAIRIARETCAALEAVHAQGIVHRDVKPSNLFLERERVVLLDFGISKPGRTGTSTLTRADDVIGSPHYMSPEQVMSARDVDARSDVWGVGVVLYEMLTGRRPFNGSSMMQLGALIRERTPTSIRQLRPEVSTALERVVMRCLEKDPAQRYANARDLARALADMRAPRSRFLAAGAALGLVIVGVGLYAMRPKSQPAAAITRPPDPVVVVSAPVTVASSASAASAPPPVASPIPTTKPTQRPTPTASTKRIYNEPIE